MQRSSKLRAVCLVGLVTLFACADEGGTGPGDGQPPDASFAYELTGDVERSVTGDELEIEVGQAFDAGLLWQLHLRGGTNNENGGVSLVYRGDEPSAGSYTVRRIVDQGDLSELRSDEFAAFAELDAGPESTRFLGAEAVGDVVIQRADALGFEGTFDLTADGVTFPPGDEPMNATVGFAGSFGVPR